MADDWLSRNNFAPSDRLHNTDLNNLANDIRNWRGDVNGGGFKLSNVVLSGSGGFEYTASPIQITPGTNGQSAITLVQTTGSAPNQVQAARWTFGKTATPEGGGNSGSDFAIVRYANDGTTVLGTPLSIERSTGIVTLAAGAVIPGYAKDPTTAKGDLLVHGASALVALASSGVNGQVLTVDTTTASGLKWAASSGGVSSWNTRGGAVVLQLSDLTAFPMGASGASHAPGLVPDTPAQAGNTKYLREDGIWAVPAGGTGGGMVDPTQNVGDLIVRGPGGTTNLGIGSQGQVLTIDTAAANKVKWATPSAAGSPQTPWVQDIDGNGKALFNPSKIGVGVATAALTTYPLQVNNGSIGIKGPAKSSNTSYGYYVESAPSDSPNTLQGWMALVSNATTSQNRLVIGCVEQGIAWRNVTLCETAGFVGIGTTAPLAALHVSSASTSAPRGIISEQTSNDSNAAWISGYKSRAGTAVQNGDVVYSVPGYAFDGGSYVLAGRLKLFVDGTVSGGSVPGSLAFHVGGDVERMRLNASGQLAVGTTPTSTPARMFVQFADPNATDYTRFLIGPSNSSGGFYIQGGHNFGTATGYANFGSNVVNTPSGWKTQNNNAEGWMLGFITGSPGGGNFQIVNLSSGATATVTIPVTVTKDRVGINTAGPGYALDVNGGINTNVGFYVNGNPISGGGGITQRNIADSGAQSMVTYRNTTGKAMYVAVTVLVTPNQQIVAYTDNNSAGPNQVVVSVNNFNASINQVLNIGFWVLNLDYYRVYWGGTLQHWIEWW